MKDRALTKLAEHFRNPDSAAIYLESIRWPDGPVCPHCGESERAAYRINRAGSKARLWKCAECRRQFTVTVGTVFERSHIPLNQWLHVMHLMCASKKGMSSLQIARMLQVTYKTAWFMTHRIRLALAGTVLDPHSLKGVVEVDETYVGGVQRGRITGRGTSKAPVVALVERGGRIKLLHVKRLTAKNLKGAVREFVHPSATIMTDEFASYTGLADEFKGHEVVKHTAKEYARGAAHVNSAEGFFGLLKRGVNGTFHSISKRHLFRYLGEFEYRHNTRTLMDGQRTNSALKRVGGKRLMYRDSSGKRG